jgi:hypothetical protein
MRHLRNLLTWTLDTRAAKWLHRRRQGIELLWHVTCAVMVWLAILLPTPRMLATVVGCGVLLLLEQRRLLRSPAAARAAPAAAGLAAGDNPEL